MVTKKAAPAKKVSAKKATAPAKKAPVKASAKKAAPGKPAAKKTATPVKKSVAKAAPKKAVAPAKKSAPVSKSSDKATKKSAKAPKALKGVVGEEDAIDLEDEIVIDEVELAAAAVLEVDLETELVADLAEIADDEDAEPVVAPESDNLIISDVDDTDEPVQQVITAGATADPVKDYLKQIGKVPLLNAEEEVDLAKRIEAGLFSEELLATRGPFKDRRQGDYEWIAEDGQRAKNHLLEANLRLVVSLAKRYTGRGMLFLGLNSRRKLRTNSRSRKV